MTAPRARRPLLRAACFGALAAALAAACETRAPMAAAPRPAAEVQPGSFGAWGPDAWQPFYPQVLRNGMPKEDIIVLVVDGDHRVVTHHYLPAANRSWEAHLKGARGHRDMAFMPVMLYPAGSAAPTEVRVLAVMLDSGVPPSVVVVPTPGELLRPPLREELGPAIARHYPPLLRDAGITASVLVSLQVDAGGKAQDAVVIAGDPRFEQATLAVVRDVRFPTPGRSLLNVEFGPARASAPATR